MVEKIRPLTLNTLYLDYVEVKFLYGYTPQLNDKLIFFKRPLVETGDPTDCTEEHA